MLKAIALKEMRVLVVGLARTGVSVARFLKSKGAEVIVSDIKTSSQLKSSLDELRDLDIEFELEDHKVETFKNVDLIVVSPGVPLDIKPVKEAHRHGIEIMSEVELAYHFIDTPIIAITGTNGKSTTTVLISNILEASGYKVYVGGNIGSPLIDYALSNQDRDYVVAEISSFQLDGIRTFRPKIGILLNITEDHLDRYPTLSSYIYSKSRMFTNQSTKDIAILNKDDSFILKIQEMISAKKIYFSSYQRVEEGAYADGGFITCRDGTGWRELFDIGKLKIVGSHNIQNVMGAILAAKICGCAHEPILTALEGFEGLEHRLEFVRMIGNIAFYNDSKATNVDSTIRALESFTRPVILIAGGRDKGGDYSPLRGPIKERVRLLVLLGEVKEKLSQHLGDQVPTIAVRTLEEAVRTAYSEAKPGNIVLLSPACSSFDMFNDYKERGNVFKDVVRSL